MRIGIGFDAHRFVEKKALVVGGVTIPFPKGLQGHSDADVLLHALCDAMLGALALGDIGAHFPDSDARFKGIASTKLLRAVKEMIEHDGYGVRNVDATVIAQEPRLTPHIDKMRSVISKTVGCEKGRISIKSTTTEGMGFCGRGEGIASMAVVCLEPRKKKEKN